MKITGIDVFQITLPMRRFHTWAGNYSQVGKGYILVKMNVEGGYQGLGEAQVLRDWGSEFNKRGGESTETATAIIREHLTPLLVGEDVRQIENNVIKMDKFVKGNHYAKAALDVAMHDAVGKIYGIPCYQLLGGLVRNKIPVAHSIGLMEVKKAVREAQEVVDEGLRALKVKIGNDFHRDIDIIKQIRNAVGPDISIRADANQGYRSWKEALRVTKILQEFNIIAMEQPCEGLENMARVCKNTEVPIMADESAWDHFDVLRLVQWEAADWISCYYTKAGGFLKAKKALAIAETAGMRADVNGSAEFGVGNAANLHLAASTAIVDVPGTIPVTQISENPVTKVAGHKYTDDIVTESFTYEDGHLIVPDKPGLGVEIDDKKIEKYRTG